MKNIKRFTFIILSLILILSLAAGCGSSKDDSSIEPQNSDYESSQELDSISSEEGSPGDSEEGSEETASLLEPTKLVVRFHLNMQTIEFDNSISSLEKLIDKNEAYIENSNIYLGDYYDDSNFRSAEYVIRVPKNNTNDFIKGTSSIGKINSQEESKEDVTMYYRDTESRLNVLNIKEERILELLKKADKMEDIIALENSLSDIIYEKENLTGVLKDIDNKVDFTSVTIFLREVQKISIKDDKKIGFGKRIVNAISNSFQNFIISFENFIIQLIYLLPFIVFLSLIVFGIYKAITFYRGKIKAIKDIHKDK